MPYDQLSIYGSCRQYVGRSISFSGFAEPAIQAICIVPMPITASLDKMSGCPSLECCCVPTTGFRAIAADSALSLDRWARSSGSG